MVKDNRTRLKNRLPLIPDGDTHPGRYDIRWMWRSASAFFRGRLPGQVVIQYTDRCNAHCPQCGMRVSEQFARSKLPVDSVKRIIDHAAAQGVEVVSFTGGEPLLYLDEVVELVHYARRAGIRYIRTGTNGFLFLNSDKPRWESRLRRVVDRLASTPLRNLWFSIDSADAKRHESMRGLRGVVAGMEKALPIFHSHGIYPSANLGINRFAGGESMGRLTGPSPHRDAERDDFQASAMEAFERFFEHVIGMGFTMVNMCYPISMGAGGVESDDAVYAAASVDDAVSFRDEERELIYRALLEVIPIFRHRLRIFTPLSSLEAMVRQYAEGERTRYPCRGGADFFFVSCRDGHAFPCGYRGGDDLGPFWDLDLSKPPCDALCTACDWECFRDPSEVLGPFAAALAHPLRFVARGGLKGCLSSRWRTDLSYYRACGFFDGRLPADRARLMRFAPADSLAVPGKVEALTRPLPPSRKATA